MYGVSNINTDFLPKFEFLSYCMTYWIGSICLFSSDDTFVNRPSHAQVTLEQGSLL